MRIHMAVELFFLGTVTMAWATEDAATAPATHPERQPGASTAPTTTTSADARAAKVMVSQAQVSLYPLFAVSERLGLALFVHLQYQQSQPHAVCLIDLKKKGKRGHSAFPAPGSAA